MFARKVSVRLKPNCVPQFMARLEHEVLPILRKQKGFQDEITFVTPSGSQAFALSLWDRAENADAYAREYYTLVAKIVEPMIEGTAEVEIFNVTSSTLHKAATAAMA